MKNQRHLTGILQCILILSAHTVLSQNSFRVSTNHISIVKNTGYFVVYDLVELTNLSSQPLEMRWIKTIEKDFPTGWDSGVQDPDTNMLSANNITTHDFTLNDTNNLLIYQVYPNQIPGAAVVNFLIFPISDPTDSVRVVFDISIHIAATGIHDSGKNEIFLYPNPCTEWFSIDLSNIESLSLFNQDGYELLLPTDIENGCFDIGWLASGVYLVTAKKGEQFFFSKIVKH